MGHFFALSRNTQLRGISCWLAGVCEQVDKWSFCLIAPTMAANRRDHEQETAPEPHTGFQGESGACLHQGRSNVGSGTSFRVRSFLTAAIAVFAGILLEVFAVGIWTAVASWIFGSPVQYR
jgi:hypothetical protein